MLRETDLYEPVRRFLEAAGYVVKSEVECCDVVAAKDGAPVVVVELKTTFSLDLVLQGVDRLALSDAVYLAVPGPDTPAKRRSWRSRRRRVAKLCRRLGLGLLLVGVAGRSSGRVDVVCDPEPYRPRANKRRQARLAAEFEARAGDPNTGGMAAGKRMTAYRQAAIRCAAVLAERGPCKVSCVRDRAQADNAGSILAKNHYGWFERASHGVYRLSEAGRAAYGADESAESNSS